MYLPSGAELWLLFLYPRARPPLHLGIPFFFLGVIVTSLSLFFLLSHTSSDFGHHIYPDPTI
ncbi:hypothetical protein IMZ48_21685 [Candidatus Bathyarchaeota archaeon]|nr:hypothetical protein [Candidatus Bathyarchaeota archaeon]